MRSGSVIELDLPVGNKVDLLVNNLPWAKGELRMVNNNLAVCINSFDVKELSHPESDTRVQLQVAEHELEVETFLELNQIGAAFPVETKFTAPVSIVISGEQVAKANLAQLDG